MEILIGIGILLFGGGFFARQVRSVPQGAWAGPRTRAQKQRGPSGQRPVRHEIKLAWEKARATNWLEAERHHRKNGTGPSSTAAAVTGAKPAAAGPITAVRQRTAARKTATSQKASTTMTHGPSAMGPSRPPGYTDPWGNVGRAMFPTPAQQHARQSQPSSPGRSAGMAASGHAVEQLVEGVNAIHATAQAGGIHAKHAGVKASHEGSIRFAGMAGMLSREMSEPGQHYGPEITEPIAKAGVHLQAAAMAFSEADAALTSLANMTVGDLANSPRQAPHHAEMSENGSH